jgi:ABC-type dipeptide/oligopeptide/nickel transport system ATPase subunit/ABC-type dipeptide/oligopeptide/nickel transport system permease subunit
MKALIRSPLLGLLVLVLCGQWLTPFDVTEPVGPPWADVGVLGTDVLGRDVLSRTLAGGAGLLGVALPVGLLTSALGALAGLATSWSTVGGWLVRRASAALLAAPGLLLVLTCAMWLPAWAAVLCGMLLLGVPMSARIVYSAAAPLRHAGFVRAAQARGERSGAVVMRELLPAVSGTVLADAGQRVVAALRLAVAVNVVGLGAQPPTPDWAVMVRENLPGAALAPWSVLAPALALTVLSSVLALGLDLAGQHVIPAVRPRPGISKATRLTPMREDGLSLTGVRLRDRDGSLIFDGFDLTVPDGGIVAITGPSGAGKTTLLLLLLGVPRPGTVLEAGGLRHRGVPVRHARRWRRANVGLLGQDPVAALDPLREVRSEVPDTGLLTRLGLPADVADRRPSTLSGGQAQRVALARALLADPAVLLMDEPTSGLDVGTRQLVTAELARRRRAGRVTVLVSHDVTWCARLADRIVEIKRPSSAPEQAIDHAPRIGEPALSVRGLTVSRGGRTLLSSVDLTLHEGELAVLLGPSGSGKSSLLHDLLRQHGPDVQLVEQDPVGALNPAHTLVSSVARPSRVLHGLTRRQARRSALDLLTEIGLDDETALRLPGRCSGGQRQRACLARAFAARPRVLLADEPTSALDSTTAAVVLDVLNRRRAAGLAVLLVTHDEDLAARADRVYTMVDGKVR